MVQKKRVYTIHRGENGIEPSWFDQLIQLVGITQKHLTIYLSHLVWWESETEKIRGKRDHDQQQQQLTIWKFARFEFNKIGLLDGLKRITVILIHIMKYERNREIVQRFLCCWCVHRQSRLGQKATTTNCCLLLCTICKALTSTK